MAKQQVTLGNESWVLDEETLTLRDAFAIKAASGLALKPFFNGINDVDPEALQALIWFLRYRDGNAVDIATIDFNVADLRIEPIVEVADNPPADAVAETEAPTSATDETPISDSSPTSAT